MTAFDVGGNFTLSFTKVLDESQKSRESESENPPEVSRASWEANTSKEAIQTVDVLAGLIQKEIGKFELKYNKFYIGCVVDGRPANFIAFKPQRSGLRIDLGMKLDPAQVTLLEEANIEVLPYAAYWKVHPVRLTKEQATNPPRAFLDIAKASFSDYFAT
ncbi:MAG: hypothetical protein HC883_06085 [Bdellovibrionaceae bacterium]|nr:hypothetical protein [Pseudobdellovibrionaceae bacterium]